MKLSRWIVGCIGCGLFQAHAALAEDEGSFTIHMPLVNYTMTTDSAKTGGVTAEAKTTQIKTAELAGSYMEATWGKANLYIYPFFDSTKVSASFMAMETLEVGLDLGITALKRDKPEIDKNDRLYGFWGIYYLNLGKATLENGLNVGMTTSTSSETTTSTTGVATETKTDVSHVIATLSVNAVVPLAKNVNYIGGLWYVMDKGDNKENKTKTSAGTVGVNLATVRMILK